jgi:hypothetical protein
MRSLCQNAALFEHGAGQAGGLEEPSSGNQPNRSDDVNGCGLRPI